MANYVSKIKPNGEEGPEYKLKDEEARSAIQNTNNNVSGSKSVNGNPIVISDAANAYAEEVIANIEPIQDLHGYDRPWVGGAGKNKQILTVEGIISNNGGASVWSNNQRTINNITFTILTDDGNNVIGIKINGTANANTLFYFPLVNLNGTYIINGCPSGGSVESYRLDLRTWDAGVSVIDIGDGATTPALQSASMMCVIRVGTGTVCNNIIFKPMIRLATETDPTFEPYSNICPISGLDSVEVERIGKNLLDLTSSTGGTDAGITATANGDGTFTASGTNTSRTINIWLAGNFGSTSTLFTLKAGKYIVSDCRLFNNTSSIGDVVYLGTELEITLDSDTNVTGVRFPQIDGTDITLNNIKVKPMIRLATETDPTFEPYQSETHTTSLPQTTYGGTLNVQTGELVVDRVFKSFNGSETWYTDSRWPNSYYTPWANNSKYTPSNIGFGNYIQCNKYHGIAKKVDNIQNGEILFNSAAIAYINASIIIKDENYTSIDDFKASLSSTPLQIVYELATPQTYHLTPEQVKLLKGYNNITTNAETLDVTYQVDNVLGEILSESEEYADRVVDDLGKYFSAQSNTVVTMDAYTSYPVLSLSLPPGVYIIVGSVREEGDGSGASRRLLNISTDTSFTTETPGTQTFASFSPIHVTTSLILSLNSQTTVYLNAYNNDGGSKVTHSYLRAVKLSL